MAYKLKPKPPWYNPDDMNIPVYRTNFDDGSAGKSNHTGIAIQQGLPKEVEDAAIAHETVHQHQQRNGDLDYDNENFYWKGKTYPRKNMNEHNENLPWEKEAYKESNKILAQKNNDMKQSFKLTGYRGNGPAFKNLSDKGLIGASMEGGPEGDPPIVSNPVKKTKPVHTQDVNPETGMKRLTIKSSESGGGRGKSYEDAYKSADKNKYPTLPDFKKAAKSYNKEKIEVIEQIPTKGAIKIDTQPKIRDIKGVTTTDIPEKTPTPPKKDKPKKSNYKAKKRKPTKYKKKSRKPQFCTKSSTSC